MLKLFLKNFHSNVKTWKKKQKNNSCIPDNKIELQIPGKYEFF